MINEIKKYMLTAFALCATMCSFAQWKPMGEKIKTQWADAIDVNNVLPEYPRPIMERSDWKNLNGLWNYAILPMGNAEPTVFDGEILVPFAIESSLSGVQKELGKDKELWYQTTFSIPSNWKNREVLLHFGAVDWKTEVYLNDIKIGEHKGGYTPFSFNISPYLKSGKQKLIVKVWDPTTDGYQPVGKQHTNPNGIWYTAVSGIWQTVWLEPVNLQHITHLKLIPHLDSNSLKVDVETSNTNQLNLIEVIVKEGNRVVSRAKGAINQQLTLAIDNPKLWSPESPFLYDVEIKLFHKNRVVDEVSSYAAMRKIATKKGADGIVRIQLNNKDYFQFGPLDQGWWPDGLYTAPTDEALVYDIQKTKELGFNMIRKHVKVEPARWYTHCDKIGLLVWQDMPNGDKSPQWQNRQYFEGSEMKRSQESEQNFYSEWKEIMDFLISYPSIVTWVPFNEAWGQFKTDETARWTKMYDPSRLVNPASGGNHYYTGDMLDLHNYPGPEMYLFDAQRANVLGEYGGIGLPLENHLWQPDKNWGYIQFKNAKEVTDEYEKYGNELLQLIKVGFSAAVYTQTTDVEVEVNGLMTYDRKIIKVEKERVRRINNKICNSLSK